MFEGEREETGITVYRKIVSYLEEGWLLQLATLEQLWGAAHHDTP